MKYEENFTLCPVTRVESGLIQQTKIRLASYQDTFSSCKTLATQISDKIHQHMLSGS